MGYNPGISQPGKFPTGFGISAKLGVHRPNTAPPTRFYICSYIGHHHHNHHHQADMLDDFFGGRLRIGIHVFRSHFSCLNLLIGHSKLTWTGVRSQKPWNQLQVATNYCGFTRFRLHLSPKLMTAIIQYVKNPWKLSPFWDVQTNLQRKSIYIITSNP